MQWNRLQATLWRLEASALLEVQERVLPAGAREVRFTQIEGDFKVLGCNNSIAMRCLLMVASYMT